MAGQQETFQRLVDAGWDEDTAREAAAIEHGDHGCTTSEGKGDDEPKPRRRVRRRNIT